MDHTRITMARVSSGRIYELWRYDRVTLGTGAIGIRQCIGNETRQRARGNSRK